MSYMLANYKMGKDMTIALSKSLMLCLVAGGFVEGSKGRVLRHASSFDIVTVMVHQVAVFGLVEHLP